MFTSNGAPVINNQSQVVFVFVLLLYLSKLADSLLPGLLILRNMETSFL